MKAYVLNNMSWLSIEKEGIIATHRIVAVGLIESAPIRRLIQTTEETHIVILTGGRKRRSVLILDSGHVVITALTIAVLIDLLNNAP